MINILRIAIGEESAGVGAMPASRLTPLPQRLESCPDLAWVNVPPERDRPQTHISKEPPQIATAIRKARYICANMLAPRARYRPFMMPAFIVFDDDVMDVVP
jgi:hypothetical protein